MIKTRTASKWIVLASCVLLIVSTSNVLANEGNLKRSVEGYSDSALSCFALAFQAGKRYGVPVGVEIDKRTTDKTTTVHFKTGTVADLFSAIVAQMPGYTWAEDGGVVNIMPIDHEDTILDVKIARFEVKKLNQFELPSAISSTPEVKAWLARNGLTERTPMGGIFPGPSKHGPSQRSVSVNLHDVTVRYVLNYIVRKSEWTDWSVRRYGDNNEYINIYIN